MKNIKLNLTIVFIIFVVLTMISYHIGSTSGLLGLFGIYKGGADQSVSFGSPFEIYHFVGVTGMPYIYVKNICYDFLFYTAIFTLLTFSDKWKKN